MARDRRDHQGFPNEKAGAKMKGFSFKIEEELFSRMEDHVKSQFSRVKTKSDFIKQAVSEFLDREEPMAEKLREVRLDLEKQL